jgi:hypothetical protein
VGIGRTIRAQAPKPPAPRASQRDSEMPRQVFPGRVVAVPLLCHESRFSTGVDSSTEAADDGLACATCPGRHARRNVRAPLRERPGGHGTDLPNRERKVVLLLDDDDNKLACPVPTIPSVPRL